MQTLEDVLAQKQGSIVDVRTLEEFRSGHVQGAVHIPLQELEHRLSELQTLAHPLILCCASGIRSRKAQKWLEQQGIVCLDGGSWMEIQYIQGQLSMEVA